MILNFFFFKSHGINFIIKKKTIKIPNIGRFGIEIQFSKIKPTIHTQSEITKKGKNPCLFSLIISILRKQPKGGSPRFHLPESANQIKKLIRDYNVDDLNDKEDGSGIRTSNGGIHVLCETRDFLIFYELSKDFPS